MSLDADRRRRHVMFPGRRGDDYPPQSAAPGSRPRNDMPVRPYTYQGPGHDTLTAWLDNPAGGRGAVPPSPPPAHGLTMCPRCWDDLCEVCMGEPCACACETGRTA